MSTLFQLHAPINTLKSLIKEMAILWQTGDRLLLLGETAAYASWLDDYIEDINMDDELDIAVDGVAAIYVLQKDVDALNEEAFKYLGFNTIKTAPIHLLTDEAWVTLTDDVDRVVTLSA